MIVISAGESVGMDLHANVASMMGITVIVIDHLHRQRNGYAMNVDCHANRMRVNFRTHHHLLPKVDSRLPKAKNSRRIRHNSGRSLSRRHFHSKRDAIRLI